MAIVKMRRLRVIALGEEREDLLQQLLHVGCVEVTEPEGKLSDPEWAALLRRETSALGEVKSKSNAVSGALEALRKYAPVKSGLFTLRDTMKESDFLSAETLNGALTNAAEINDRVGRVSQLFTQENRLAGQRASLIPWTGLDLPLDTKSTEHVQINFAVCPAGVDLGEVRAALTAAAPSAELFEASTDKELHYLLLVCHQAESEAVAETVKPYGLSNTSFKEFTGTAAENIVRIDDQLATLVAEREAVTAEIATYSDCRQALRVCADRLVAEQAKEGAREKLLTNGTILFMEGWITEPGLPRAEEVLSRFSCAWETAEPLDEEEPPILLDDPKWMTPINMVTEMYSMPAYRSIDPNPLIFWFYVFFFGFMFADIAYGIIIWAVCYFITKKYKPKFTMGYMFKLGQYLGISTAICGIFSGGFFGDLIPKVSQAFFGLSVDQLPGWLQTFCNGIIVNPIGNPMPVLIIAIGIGVVHLLFGQCVHIYMGFRDGKGVDALLDVVPWWAFFASIGLVAAGFPGWCILLGCLLLVATQGRSKRGLLGKILGGVASLYDVTAWLSDILSYARLMALMLATSVIASVMNTLGTLGGPSVLGIILFIVVFFVGHTFNIGVNVIGTYVHAARLQYLEFYGKFFEEGGVAFQPLAYQTKFVDIIEEEQ